MDMAKRGHIGARRVTGDTPTQMAFAHLGQARRRRATVVRAAAAFVPAAAPSGGFADCAAARAAGAAPVHRGDPGCAPHLDRDDEGVGVGVGCES